MWYSALTATPPPTAAWVLFSTGIGYTEMASILGTGTLWVKVPETIKVVIDGELPANVMSKDVILRLIGDLGADGATYRALEFTGSAVKNMSIASRTTMANMAIEAGASARCSLRMKRPRSTAALSWMISRRAWWATQMLYT